MKKTRVMALLILLVFAFAGCAGINGQETGTTLQPPPVHEEVGAGG